MAAAVGLAAVAGVALLFLLAESSEFDDAAGAGAAGVACAGAGAAIAGAALTGATLTGLSPTELAGSAKAAEVVKSRAIAVEANNRSARIPDITYSPSRPRGPENAYALGWSAPNCGMSRENFARGGGTLREPYNFVL
ncbi:MAG: hypothetical protein WAU57_07460 [Xanthobacteraceae bacterium]